MNLLRFGSQGPQVTQLQQRLNEIYKEQIKVDGDFGELTEAMVIDFQETNGLQADGIVGPDTWRALYEEAPEDAEELSDDPILPPVLLQSQLTSLFGKPRDPATYLVVLDFSEFKSAFSHVKNYLGQLWSCRIYAHKLMEAPLREAFGNLIGMGFASELKTFDGCVCVRPMTSGNGWSVHSWGLALDFNAGTNGYGREPSLSSGFVKCFTDAGFEWGGNWRGRGGRNDFSGCDGMHFQLPKTRG
jgi:hypothetical protein